MEGVEVIRRAKVGAEGIPVDLVEVEVAGEAVIRMQAGAEHRMQRPDPRHTTLLAVAGPLMFRAVPDTRRQ